MEQRISIERMEQAVNIFGSFDENIRLLEKEFNVTVTNRDGELRISGEAEDVMHAAKAVQAMLTLSSRGEALGEQNVRYIIDMVRTGKEEQISELAGDVLCISAKGRPVKPKTLGQKEYIASVLKNTVTIGVGPAGTGKTYLAVAAAVQAFREKQVNRIILTRPAVEAGERLGFLPQGVHYDALEVSPAAPLTADVTGYRLLRSSDAHSLEQMLEREFALEAETRSVDAVFDAIAGRTQPD